MVITTNTKGILEYTQYVDYSHNTFNLSNRLDLVNETSLTAFAHLHNTLVYNDISIYNTDCKYEYITISVSTREGVYKTLYINYSKD
jgi:hypothetical protein